ncbi:MAG TPA: type II toxin-antitoxin system HicB family antitoxin [Candidatus Methylomirabilis sp.]|nr:type II toxin-antitoxin system HicB family antitoxin [Candidatus Methylomirabilis sp.]
MKAVKMSQRDYRIIVEQDEEGYFVGTVPALPGCHTQGKSLEELRKNLREVIELCLDVAKDDPEYRKRIEDFAYEPSFVGLDIMRV